MGDNKNSSYEVTTEKSFEQKIVQLNVEIDLLNTTYNCLLAENNKLKKIFDALQTCVKENDAGIVDKQHFRRVCAIAKLAIGKQSHTNTTTSLSTNIKKVMKVIPIDNLNDVPSTSQRTISGDNNVKNGVSKIFRKANDEKESIPEIPSANKEQRKLPPHIMQLIYEKKRLRRILHRTGDPLRIPSLKSDISNLDRIIKDAIAKYDEKKLNKLMSRVTIAQGVVLPKKTNKKA